MGLPAGDTKGAALWFVALFFTAAACDSATPPEMPPPATAWFRAIDPLVTGIVAQAPVDLSGDGTVVVGNGIDGSLYRSFRWTPAAGIEDLSGSLPLSAYASTISRDGRSIAGTVGNADASQLFRWAPPTAPSMLPLADGYVACHLYAGNADLAVLVGVCYNDPAFIPARWTAGSNGATVEELPLGDPTRTVASLGALSDDGSVIVGGFADASGVVHGARWLGGSGTAVTVEDLGSYGSDPYLNFCGCSADGAVVVGTSQSADFTPSPVRWTAQAGLSALPLLAGAGSGEALRVDASGARIFGDVNTSSDPNQSIYLAYEPVIWDDSGVHDLRAMLVAAGVAQGDLTGWTLGTAVAISADGKTFIGAGTNPGGEEQGWVAHLP
jgi:uncharacterized membrane protein